MGYGVMVARWFLAPVVGVQIPVSQPVFFVQLIFFEYFFNMRNLINSLSLAAFRLFRWLQDTTFKTRNRMTTRGQTEENHEE